MIFVVCEKLLLCSVIICVWLVWVIFCGWLNKFFNIGIKSNVIIKEVVSVVIKVSGRYFMNLLVIFG